MNDELVNGEHRVAGVAADLDMLFGEVEALRELAGDPQASADQARVYDFSIRWGTLLAGRLPRLEHYYRNGGLTPDERARYDALRVALREALPMVERLGIARPSIPLGGADDR
ncbi:hypothetical protein ACQP1K_13170 [Sphaerimonospora sp. CA-214678]|uniref:hypothetical protein n=1 Tax=Sphaerimonospora sp. CA-214678 TaxID=3240029 RepID=UPI003D8BBA22